MKKFRAIMIIVLAVVMCLGLAACGSQDTGKVPEGSGAPDMVQFKGIIESIDGNEAIVTPDEGEDILSSGDAVRVNIADYSKPLKAGDAVTIYYDGIIMESYPLQINVLGINDETFEIKEPAKDSN